MGSACCNKSNKEKQGGVRPSEQASAATAATTACCTAEKEGCNEVCIKNAAAIMCHSDTNGHATGFQSANEGGPQTPLPSACGTHLQRAMDKYQSFLESALCICRDMRGQGIRINCCSIGTDKHQNGRSYLSLAGESLESARCGDIDKTPATTAEEIHGGHNELDHAGEHAEHGHGHGSHGCCGSPVIPASIDSIQHRDIEKGQAGTQAMTILVSGMTCSGCGDQLRRALLTIEGVDNVNVNFMQGRANFTFQPSLVNMNNLIRKTQGATGFEITLLSTDESIDVLLTQGVRVRRAAVEAATGLCQQLLFLDGVNEVTSLTKTRVRIHYDPLIIGARDLTDKAIASGLCSGLAPPESDRQLTAGRSRYRILFYQTIASTVLTIPVLVLAWSVENPSLSLAVINKHTRSIISLVLATLVQILSIPVFYAPALTALVRYKVLELDMLVVMSITAAYVYSVVAFGYAMAGRGLQTGEFFETSTLLVTLIMLGRLVASWARIKAVGAVSLGGLQVQTAMLVDSSMEGREGGGDGGGGAEEVREIDARLLQFGDRFKVLPHSRVPTDGVVVSGVSEVDEAMLTGESMPVTKRAGDKVAAGTMNGSGLLVVRLTRLPSCNTVTDIARLVEDAGTSKPRVQELADRVAGWFLPAVLGIAALVLVVWSIVGVKLQEQTAGEAVSMAVTYVVAVLAVSCPCALGLAVPMVLVIANGIAASGGVVIKSAGVAEQARKVTDIVFDKTGTLTEPNLDVVTEEYFGNDPREMRAILLALVRDNKHPVSDAVAKHITGTPNVPEPSTLVESLQSIPGMGIEGVLNSTISVRAGSPSWAIGPDNDENLPVVIQNMLNDGQSILVLSLDWIPAAVLGLRSRLRHNARSIVSSLQERNIAIHLVSGDQPAAVHSVAQTLGIHATNVVAQQTPQQKQAYVATLTNNGTIGKKRIVIFCGDGTNDAPAVAQADIGIQLISDSFFASDVTRSAADIVLLSGLEGIPFLLDISRAAFARIAFNFVWSALYNVLAILLAAGAFVEVRIAPAYAGAGEMVSVLPVIAAAVSMLLVKVKA